MKIAAIDIGSNALRLLIKETDCEQFLQNLDSLTSEDYYERVPLKSGMDVFAHKVILPKTEIVLTAALCRFSEIMKAKGVSHYRACATSAYRDAQNGSEVINRVNKTSGLNVEIIPGEEEARITRLSFQVPEAWRDHCLVFADVGGGSTEISVIQSGVQKYGHSFQIGSMRYLCNIQDPEQVSMLDQTIAGIRATSDNIHCLGVGGCVKFMCKHLNGKNGSRTIRVSDMQAVYEDLTTKTVDQIVETYKLPHERADILTPASSIFLRIAHNLGVKTIEVPQIGVRNGILTELYNIYK